MDSRNSPDLPAAATSLVEFWADLRGLNILPHRSEIDPLRLRQWIGDVSLIDVHEGEKRFWVRLHGTNVEAYIGKGFEHKYLEDCIPPYLHSVALKPYFTSIEKRLPTYSLLRPGLLTGKFGQLERLVLPFYGSEADTVERFLIWVGPSKRNRFECESVYGKSVPPVGEVAEDISTVITIQPTVR